MKARLRLKGGSGSGHHGHAGRPGQRGGSTPGGGPLGGVEFLTIDFFSGKPISSPSFDDRQLAEDVVRNSVAVTNVDLSDVGIIVTDGVIVGDILGSSTSVKKGALKGKEVVVVSTKALDAAITNNSLQTMGRWNGIYGDVTRDGIFQHVIAHEIGHKWYDQQSGLVKESWRRTFTANFGDMSEYARYYRDIGEGLADSYAGFVLGYPIPSQIEDWFMDNT